MAGREEEESVFIGADVEIADEACAWGERSVVCVGDVSEAVVGSVEFVEGFEQGHFLVEPLAAEH